jgi:hypothetical protein
VTDRRIKEELAHAIVEGDRLIRERRWSAAIAAGCGLGGLARLAPGVDAQDVAHVVVAIMGLLIVATVALVVGWRSGKRLAAGRRRASVLAAMLAEREAGSEPRA